MADAGFRLTVEGEKEFRKAIGDVNAILRLNQAELQKVTAEYNASEKGMEDMSKKQSELGEVLKRQTDAVAQMEGELERLTESYGENDKGVIKMRTELDKAKASLAGMQAQFKANAEEIENAAKVTGEYTESMEDIDAQIKAFAAEIKAMDADMNNANGTMSIFGRNADETGKQVEDLKKKGELLTSMIDEQKKKMDTLNDEMEEAVKLYGSQSREVAEYRTEIANATTELKDMEKQLEDNNDKIDDVEKGAMDLSDVFGQISEITGIEIPDGLEKMIGGVDSATAAAGLTVTAVLGIGKAIKQTIEDAESFGRELTKVANEINMTAKETLEWQYIADKIGVEFEGVADIMKNLREKMYEAANGNQELREEFESLNVGILEANGELRKAQEVLVQLVDEYGKVSNETERAARMQKLLGDNSKLLNSFIETGTKTLEEYRKEANETGYVIETEMIEKMDKAAKKTEEVNRAWETFKRNMGVSMEVTRQQVFSEGFSVEKQIENQKFAVDALKNWLNQIWEKLTGNYATGTYNHPGGYALVGERGPEIVDLPAGSRVYPNKQYPEMGATNNYYVTISAADVREFNDIVRLAQSKRVTERMQ